TRINRLAPRPRLGDDLHQCVAIRERVLGRAFEADAFDDLPGCTVVPRSKERLPQARALQRSPRAHARVCAYVARVAEDLVDVEKVAAVWHHEQRRVMSRCDQPLERTACSRAKLQPVDHVESELDQTRTELEAPAAVLHEIAARMQRADESVCATAGQTQPLADLRHRKAVRFG